MDKADDRCMQGLTADLHRFSRSGLFLLPVFCPSGLARPESREGSLEWEVPPVSLRIAWPTFLLYPLPDQGDPGPDAPYAPPTPAVFKFRRSFPFTGEIPGGIAFHKGPEVFREVLRALFGHPSGKRTR